MKKIICLLLVLLPLSSVKAEEYYSDYTNWQVVEEIPKMDSDLLEVKEEHKYLWYTIKKEGNYFKEGEEHPEYPIKTDFWTFSTWSDWSLEKKEESLSQEQESRTIYRYQTMKPITYIRFSNMSSIHMNEIQIYNGEEEIDFDIVEDKDNILLLLKNPCYVESLKVKIILQDSTNLEKHLQIEWLYDLETPVAMDLYSRFWFNGSYTKEYHYQNMVKKNIVWNDTMTSLEKVEASEYQLVQEETEYRYRDRLYYYEREWREYLDGYHSLMDEAYPDLLTDKTTLYIRTRKRLEPSLVPEEKSIEENLVEDAVQEPLQNSKEFISSIPKNQNVKKNAILKPTCEALEKELEEANSTLMSSLNEKSEMKEEQASKSIDLKKQSVISPYFFYLVLFFLGMVFGRTLTKKKKF